MAEVVELRSEEMIPEFEQMEKLQLFNKSEIRYYPNGCCVLSVLITIFS